MLKMLNACTSELDNVQIAVGEILEKLNLEENLLKNSAAIITAYQDSDDDVIRAIAKSLPCDSIGVTTFMAITQNKCDEMIITVSVLTSDTIEFAVGCSEDIVHGSEKEFSEPLKNTLAKVNNPQAILGCAPLLTYASVDFYTNAVNKINPELLFFSGVAIDNTPDYHLSNTIFNGEKFNNRFSFIVMGKESGKINLDFAVATLSPEKSYYGRKTAIVTKSANSRIIEIDGAPVSSFFTKLGLTQNENGSFEGINAYPFIVDFRDNTQPVIRGIFAFTPEGEAVISGDVPDGAKLSIGEFDISEIVNTTTSVLAEFVEKNKDANGFILFSCCGRYFNLGFDNTEEADKIKEIIGTTNKPFLFSYVGGEICPVYRNGIESVNRGHSYTCIMAAF